MIFETGDADLELIKNIVYHCSVKIRLVNTAFTGLLVGEIIDDCRTSGETSWALYFSSGSCIFCCLLAAVLNLISRQAHTGGSGI